MMIEEYKKYSNDYFANPEIILDFNKLKNEFLKKFDKVVNKKEYLHQEIFNIEKNISEKIGCIKNQYSDYSIYYDSGFNNYYFNSIEPTLDIQIHIEEIISLLNGFQLAKYKKFLNEQQINLQNNLQKPTKNDKFSHLQQLWILKSFINNNKSLTNTKLSEFYSQILNKDKETTRQKLSEINSGITIKKLKEIHDFFIKFEFHEQAQYINNQIEKKSNRKK
ncbi:MAG: hypothetical protein HXX18_06350 [Bacteroidetes bacterium]|nr:hypothetical protein [Bacteroidota bacterium]